MRPWLECLTLPPLAVRGADEADRIAPVGLNFEVKARRITFDGYYIPKITLQSQYRKSMMYGYK
jgi:hypothetical protein